MAQRGHKIDRFTQMSQQEELIAKKRQEILEKQRTTQLAKAVVAAQTLAAKKKTTDCAVEEVVAATTANESKQEQELLVTTTSSSSSVNVGKPLKPHIGKIGRYAFGSKRASAPVPKADQPAPKIQNSFCNDGSFLENFKKIIETQKPKAPVISIQISAEKPAAENSEDQGKKEEEDQEGKAEESKTGNNENNDSDDTNLEDNEEPKASQPPVTSVHSSGTVKSQSTMSIPPPPPPQFTFSHPNLLQPQMFMSQHQQEHLQQAASLAGGFGVQPPPPPPAPHAALQAAFFANAASQLVPPPPPPATTVSAAMLMPMQMHHSVAPPPPPPPPQLPLALAGLAPLYMIPAPEPLQLNAIPQPKDFDLNAIPNPKLNLDAIQVPVSVAQFAAAASNLDAASQQLQQQHHQNLQHQFQQQQVQQFQQQQAQHLHHLQQQHQQHLQHQHQQQQQKQFQQQQEKFQQQQQEHYQLQQQQKQKQEQEHQMQIEKDHKDQEEQLMKELEDMAQNQQSVDSSSDQGDNEPNDQKCSQLPTTVETLIDLVAANGDLYEDYLRSRKNDLHQALWFLFDKSCQQYQSYRQQLKETSMKKDEGEDQDKQGNDNVNQPDKQDDNSVFPVDHEDTANYPQDEDLRIFPTANNIQLQQESSLSNDCSNNSRNMFNDTQRGQEYSEERRITLEKYDPESVISDDVDSDDEYMRGIMDRNLDNIKRRIECRNELSEEERLEREAAEQANDDERLEFAREKRKRERKSRWGEKVKQSDDSAATSSCGGQIMLSTVSRTDPALLAYARQNYGSINLSEDDWKKCEEHYKVNLLYQDMMRKRQEIDRLARSGKFRYEYDSDEDVEGGTWEHKLRCAEMEATQAWAQALTEQSRGKHHIGDFLPPEELKKFMEQYEAKKSNRQPDLSDYKEYKLKEDNIGFKMLQKLGWKEGQGLGQDGSGIVDPVNKGTQREGNQGLGVASAAIPEGNDNEYDAYRKRMMLAYRFRPNPLNNPRRAYY